MKSSRLTPIGGAEGTSLVKHKVVFFARHAPEEDASSREEGKSKDKLHQTAVSMSGVVVQPARG